MWAAGGTCLRRLCGLLRRSCNICGRAVLPLSALALLLTVPGCCSTNSIPGMTGDMPALPVLTSLQRLTLDGTPGVWMDDADAGRLAVWIRDVTGETGQ